MRVLITTDRDWLDAKYPMHLIRFLGDRMSERKKSLLVAACFRRIWHLLKTERGHRAVDVLEKFADGEVTEEELAQAKEDAWQSSSEIPNPEGNRLPETQALAAIGLHDSLRDMIMGAAEATAWVKVGTPEAVSGPEEVAQCAVVREVVGNPFRRVTLDPARLTPTVIALARAAYHERHLPRGELDRDRLSILTDALEEAGCTEQAILDHLRSPGPHVRGCWAVDLVLSKK